MDGISSDGTVKKLRWLEAQAEQAYCDMYYAQASQLAAPYNDAKEFLYDAIGLAAASGRPTRLSASPSPSLRSRRSFAGNFRPSARSQPLQHAALPMSQKPVAEVAPALLKHGVTPIGRDVEERLEHKRPLMGERMGQDERSHTGLPKIRAAPTPMPDEPPIIDDIDIERAWSPGSAAPAPRGALDPLQDFEQRFRRKARVDQGHGIDVSGLPGAAHRRSLVKGGDSSDSDISALDFA
jgi:hypothetical protein